jgi:hypothetical protein
MYDQPLMGVHPLSSTSSRALNVPAVFRGSMQSSASRACRAGRSSSTAAAAAADIQNGIACHAALSAGCIYDPHISGHLPLQYALQANVDWPTAYCHVDVHVHVN